MSLTVIVVSENINNYETRGVVGDDGDQHFLRHGHPRLTGVVGIAGVQNPILGGGFKLQYKYRFLFCTYVR